MNTYLNLLSSCILFKNFNEENIIEKINCNIKNYNKNEIIAIEDDICSNIGIILEGNVEVQRIYESGKIITMEKLKEGSIFGEVIIFSTKHTYPATIVSSSKSKVMFIPKKEVIRLCKDSNIFLENFMTLLSNKILMLNKKVKSMSYKTIRQKLANYILEEYKKQKNKKIKLNLSKKELAEQLGIPRPSLSRELILMKEDGIITFDKKTITIIKEIYLEELLL